MSVCQLWYLKALLQLFTVTLGMWPAAALAENPHGNTNTQTYTRTHDADAGVEVRTRDLEIERRWE